MDGHLDLEWLQCTDITYTSTIKDLKFTNSTRSSLKTHKKNVNYLHNGFIIRDSGLKQIFDLNWNSTCQKVHQIQRSVYSSFKELFLDWGLWLWEVFEWRHNAAPQWWDEVAQFPLTSGLLDAGCTCSTQIDLHGAGLQRDYHLGLILKAQIDFTACRTCFFLLQGLKNEWHLQAQHEDKYSRLDDRGEDKTVTLMEGTLDE